MCLAPDPRLYMGSFLKKLARVEELKRKYQSEGIDGVNAYGRAHYEVFHERPQGHGIPDVPRADAEDYGKGQNDVTTGPYFAE